MDGIWDMGNPYMGVPYMGNQYMGNPYMGNPYMGVPYMGVPCIDLKMGRWIDRLFDGTIDRWMDR